jgi:hypothetical protein
MNKKTSGVRNAVEIVSAQSFLDSADILIPRVKYPKTIATPIAAGTDSSGNPKIGTMNQDQRIDRMYPDHITDIIRMRINPTIKSKAIVSSFPIVEF